MTHRVDIVVVGGSLGGVLAAFRAAESGCKVVLMAEERWLGGQLTVQGVPPDEHALIERGGASASYLAFRAAIRAHYRAQPGFVDRSRMTPGVTNPGDGWVSRLCFEPALAAQWFEDLLRPQVQAGRLRVFRGLRAVAALRRGDDVHAVRFAGAPGSGPEISFEAGVFVDATDSGELLALAALPYRVGKEAAAEFGEPDAPAVAAPRDQQPITHVVALRWCEAPGPVSPPPPRYAFWREQVLPHYGHRLFSDAMPGRGVSARLPFVADGETLDWWRYRRIVSRAQWQAPAAPREDVTLVNWAQNDHALSPLIDGPRPMAEVLAGAREQTLAFVHWLQTEAPRADGGRGFAQWQPAPEVFGTPDGLALQAYLRESRRIVARDTLTQRQLQAAPAGRPDSVGIGWYNLDIHPTCLSGHGTNAEVEPFELPLGAFIPAAGGNLVPACKNLGVTHLANACTRVHPVEWLVGEVAGVLAAMRWREGWPDRPQQQAALRAQLRAIGVPLHWDDTLLAQRR